MTPSEALADLRDRLSDMRATANPDAENLAQVIAALEPPGNGPGVLEVGANDQGEVVVNLPRDMTGHIVFSVQQAHDFAHTVVRQALAAAGALEGAADLEVTFPPGAVDEAAPVTAAMFDYLLSRREQAVCPACVLGNDPPVKVRLCADHAAMMGPRLDPTNHHSALGCPYCNPHGLKLQPKEG